MTTLTSYGKLSLEEQGRLIKDGLKEQLADEKPLTMADLKALFEKDHIQE